MSTIPTPRAREPTGIRRRMAAGQQPGGTRRQPGLGRRQGGPPWAAVHASRPTLAPTNILSQAWP
jgi:hypothetical protein